MADNTTVTRLLGSADPAFAPGRPAPDRAAFTASGDRCRGRPRRWRFWLSSPCRRATWRGGTSVDAISVSIISARPLNPASRAPIAPPAPRPNGLAARRRQRSGVPGGARQAERRRQTRLEAGAHRTPTRRRREGARGGADRARGTRRRRPCRMHDRTHHRLAAGAGPEQKVAMVDPPPEPPPPEKQPEKPKEEKPRRRRQHLPKTTTDGGAHLAVSHPTCHPRPQRHRPARAKSDAYGLAVQEALLAADQREAQARFTAARAKGTVILRIAIAG